MKNKEFEATVVVICLIMIAVLIGIGIIFCENKAEEEQNNVHSIRYEE